MLTAENLKRLDRALVRSHDGEPTAMHGIFCAALQGFIANKWFHGPTFQGDEAEAVKFAMGVVETLCPGMFQKDTTDVD